MQNFVRSSGVLEGSRSVKKGQEGSRRVKTGQEGSSMGQEGS